MSIILLSALLASSYVHFFSHILSVIFVVLIFVVAELPRLTWSQKNVLKGIKVQVLVVAAVLALMERLPIVLPDQYQMVGFGLGIIHVGVILSLKFNPSMKSFKAVKISGIVFLLGFCALNIWALN